jgi:hypothetical protein
MSMDPAEEFRTITMKKFAEAERALHDGDGEPRQYRLRATHVWRREDGEWKIVHRHGDNGPDNDFLRPGPLDAAGR